MTTPKTSAGRRLPSDEEAWDFDCDVCGSPTSTPDEWESHRRSAACYDRLYASMTDDDWAELLKNVAHGFGWARSESMDLGRDDDADLECLRRLIRDRGAVAAYKAELAGKVRELSDAATPGPWFADYGKVGAGDSGIGELDSSEDAGLTVAAVNLVRALIEGNGGDQA